MRCVFHKYEIRLFALLALASSFSASCEPRQRTLDVSSGRPVRVMAVGDIIAHETVNQAAFDPATRTYDYTKMLAPVSRLLSQSDLLFANQESMASDNLGISGYPDFNAPFDLIDSLAGAGFNLLSIANNHSLDTGIGAMRDTAAYYARRYPQIAVSGYNSSCGDLRYAAFERGGLTFTFAAFSDRFDLEDGLDDCSVNIIGGDNFAGLVDALCSDGDVNIVSLHFGVEDSTQVSERERAIVQNLLDRGVEVILGHHPHVLKPIIETQNGQGNDAAVAFSLGNFLHSQLLPQELLGGVLDFHVQKAGGRIEIRDVSIFLTYMYYVWGDKTHEDLLSRHDLMVLPLEALHRYSDYAQQDAARRLAEGIIDVKYLHYIPEAPYGRVSLVPDTSDPLMLVNKHFFLPADFEPADLVVPDVTMSGRTGGPVHRISASVSEHVADLFRAANAAGHELVFVSGYRDYKTQKTLYDEYVEASSVEEADAYSARPGHSEHQTGVAFDLSEKSVDMDGLDAFTGTTAAKWVAANVHRFGFVVRYPEDKQDLTQYAYESWHLRHAGPDAAAEMHEKTGTSGISVGPSLKKRGSMPI
ncbi:MAG: CapA family protein [Deltaproteobacteria bacterium]|nr:CapA family protein [Deltaproteobacteria bacterium]